MEYKEVFSELFNTNIQRNGSVELLAWLEKTDFFTAPASTKFHGACDHGLVMHSVNVCNEMLAMREEDDSESVESYAICGLLHDVCKANFYKTAYRNAKNNAGEWEKVPYFTVEDMFPFGHGEKSVYLVERFMRLKPSEAIAIRWHMGGFDEAVKGGSHAISEAYDRYPLAVKLHICDIKATYLLEKGTSAVRKK